MATSRDLEHCRTSALEDDNRANGAITPTIASVAPLARNIPSTPPRNKQVFGLLTPLATPDSPLRPNSFELCFTPPPHTPTRRPDVPKDTTSLTVSGNPSECSSDQSIIIPFLPPAGLLTPDNTPPRHSRPRFVPISHKEETEVKSKSSLSLEITSTVVEISESSKHHAEIAQNASISEPVTTQCNGIITETKRRCAISVKVPNRYCIFHIDQDTGPPLNLSANARGPQHRQSKDIAVKPTIDINSQCHGLTPHGIQCQRSVKLPAQYCHQHEYQHNDTSTAPVAPQLTIEVNSQCHGLTLRGIQCQRSIKPPAQYCYQHGSKSTDTPTTPTALQLTTEVNSRCHGLTLRGVQCQRSIKPPARYCYQHGSQSTYIPTTPAAPQLTTEVNSRCHGLTLHGIQCQRSIKPPARYCYQHDSQSTDIPTTPAAPQLTTEVNSRCHGLTLRGIQCQRSIKPPARYCNQHGSQSTDIPTTPAAPQLTTEVNSRCHGLTLRGIQCQRSIKPPARYCYQHGSQSTDIPTIPTAPKPTTTTSANSQCRGLTLHGIQCQRSVKPSNQYCYQHGSQSNNAPTTPASAISTVQITVQCNAESKSSGRHCQQQISITPGQRTMDASQPIYHHCHILALGGIVTHVDTRGFKVQPIGHEGVFVHFCDYIPEYLQLDTQQKLRKAITGNISERSRTPGYVYALNVFDPEVEGKLSLKIGYSNDVKKRHAEWKRKCHSSIRDIRGWWPQTIIEDTDDDEISIKELIGKNRQGHKGPMAAQLERLVHIELNDLATHAPYLHPNFPDVHFSDIPRLPKVDPKPCHDCSGTKHKEVFSFTCVKEGEFFGREWEDIVKPVIRKWGLFLMKYFAQDCMSFANDSRI